MVNGFEVEAVLKNLQEATTVESEQTVSQFPQDLDVANTILDMSLDFLMEDLAANPENPIPFSVVRKPISFQSF